MDAGQACSDVAKAQAAAKSLDLTRFDEAALKGRAVGEGASIVSAIPEVRAALAVLQRQFAATPPGAVMDGRDIGTVICPDAAVKIFVTATAEVRARRRAREFAAQGQTVDEAAVLADILARDERDTTRKISPMKPAADAHLLDTTHMDIEEAFRAAVDLVERARR